MHPISKPLTALTSRCVAALLAAALLPGCKSMTGPEWAVETGRITPDQSFVQVLQAPASTQAGVPFTIVVTTVGSSSCTRAAGAHVRQSGDVVEVTPRDSTRVGRNVVCTDDLAPFPRDVVLTIPAPGSYTIRVTGRFPNADPVVVEHGITVE